MAALSFIYKYGIWISIPAFLFFVIFLIMCIIGVVQAGRRARLFSVPLVERQEIEFTEAGSVVLCMEGPLLSRRFVNLEYELIGSDGIAAKSRPASLWGRSSGFTKAKMELRVYEIDHPGRYVFTIRGLGGEKASDAEHRMVFTRPNLARSLAYVLGIVFGAMFTIGSIVLFCLRLANVGGP